MATIIKQIKVYDGSAWDTADIGVDASNVTLSSNLAGGANVQAALNNILPVNQLQANKLVATDANKKLTTINTTTTQLGYLSGVTSNIQTQLNNKVTKTGDTMTGTLKLTKSSGHHFDSISSNITVGATPSENQGGADLWMLDKNEVRIGAVRMLQGSSDGRMQLRLESYNRASTSATTDSQNYLILSTHKDGTNAISVSDPQAWRSGIGAVPTTRTVNSKALSSNITLSASDVGAVPTTRTINSKALSSNISLSASDVSAAPTAHASTATTYGAGSTANYGHVKIVDALTTSAGVTGLALSARQGYILNNKISNFSNSVQASLSTATNAITSGTAKACGSISLSAGHYIVVGTVIFPSNSTGFREVIISRTSASTNAENRILHAVQAAVTGAETRVTVCGFTEIAETVTFYLNAKHNAGTTLTIPAEGSGIMAYKLH